MKNAILIILVIVTAVGIYYIYAYNQLEVTIEGASIENIGLSTTSLLLDLRVRNPNPLPITITSSTFDLYMNDYYLGQGSSESITIDGNGDHTIQAPITITYSGLGLAAIDTLLEGGVAMLEVRGAASFLFIQIPFQTSSMITLS